MITDSDYIYAFERLAIAIIKKFNPEFILISSGFDGCHGDPVGQCDLTPDLFSYMLYKLKELCP